MGNDTEEKTRAASVFHEEDFGDLPERVRSRLAERLSCRDPSVLLVSGAHTLNAVPFNVQMARTPVQPANEPVYYKSWAVKRGRLVRSWKKRWFALKGDVLDYFEDSTCTKLKGSVSMDSVRARFLAGSFGPSDNGAPSGAVELLASATGSAAGGSSMGDDHAPAPATVSSSSSSTRTLVFSAGTEQENQRWVVALRLKGACLLYKRKVKLLRGDIDWRLVRCFGDSEATTLTLEDVTLSLEGVVAVVHLLQFHPSLSCLRLRNAGVGDVSIDAIAEAIKESPRVSSIHLDQNHLTTDGVQSVCSVMLSAAPVSNVNLAENMFGDAGCAVIASSLASSHVSLQCLNLSENDITDEGARELAGCLAVVADESAQGPRRCFLRISTLSLAGNAIGAAGAMALAEACKANPSIINVELQRNAIPRGEIDAVRRAFLQGTSVRRIELEHNEAPGDAEDAADEVEKSAAGGNGDGDDDDDDDDEGDDEGKEAIVEHVRRIRSATIAKDDAPPSLIAPAKMARRMSRANMSAMRQDANDLRRAAIARRATGAESNGDAGSDAEVGAVDAGTERRDSEGDFSEDEDDEDVVEGAEAEAQLEAEAEVEAEVEVEAEAEAEDDADAGAEAAEPFADLPEPEEEADAGGAPEPEKRKKSRISAFFGRGGNKSNSTPPSPLAPKPVSKSGGSKGNDAAGSGSSVSGGSGGGVVRAASSQDTSSDVAKNDQDLRSSFSFVLHDSIALSYFKVFLMREYSEENVYFWEAIERFRSELLDGHPSVRALADNIFERYVRSGSEFDVNIISSVKKRCGEMLSGDLPLPDGRLSKVFDEAQDAVRELMERDSYPRFLKSDLWANYTEGTERRITGEKSHTGHAQRHRTETIDGQVASEQGMLQRSYLRRAAANSASSLAHLRQSVHDHLDLGVSDVIEREIGKYGREIVRYSDYADKINSRGKTQTRIVLVTDAAWYNLVPKSFEVKRRVPLREIVSMTYNLLPDDDFLFAELETGNDYLVASRRKIELLSVIAQEYRMVVDAPLQLKQLKGQALKAFTDEVDGVAIPKNDINLIWRLLVTPKGAKEKANAKKLQQQLQLQGQE